ncbi:MAG: DUF4230 domain-containing protein [Blastochloris sp.]|nr:DUF4230 domain-containing protein [Blastochloris sp.]
MKNRMFMGIVALLLALALIWGVRTCVRELTEAPRRGMEQTAEGVRKVFQRFANFQPQIFIQQNVVYEQSAPITELALVRKETRQEYFWTHRWLGSSKSIRISGNYVAKAGYDLREPFVVRVGEEPGVAVVELPQARLLSVEQVGPLNFKDEEGLWNRLTQADRETALNQAREEARKMILKSGLLNEVELEARRQLEELGLKQGLSLKVGEKEKL